MKAVMQGMTVRTADTRQAQRAVKGGVDVGRGRGEPIRDPRQLDTASGTVLLDLPQVQPGDRFATAGVAVTGSTFYGKLKDFAGLSAREAPQPINSDGAWGVSESHQKGFLLDFGGMRPLLTLEVLSDAFRIYLVLPWLGTDFGPASLFPAHNDAAPSRVPSPDGAVRVSLRGAESQKLYVQVDGGVGLDTFLDKCVAQSLAFPSNLRASVADRPPFWTHPGPLQGETTMTGLPEALTAWAADLKGPLAPKLTLQSDTPGVIDVPGGFGFLQAEKSAAASWAGSPSTSVPLRAGVPSTLPLRFPQPQDAKTWSLRSLSVSAHATLSPWIFEAVGNDPAAGAASLRIDARLSVTQGFDCAQPVELHGVGLPLGALADAEVSVELCADDQGRPAAGPALATRMLSISGAADWREALFEKPVPLKAGARAWISIKAKSGTVLWSAAPALGGVAALYAEDGTAWQPFPRMVPAPGYLGPPQAGGPKKTAVDVPGAGLRLFRTPRPEENQSRVVLSHQSGATLIEMPLPVSDGPVGVEWLWPDGARPELAPGPDRGIELGIRALSGGTLEIASATLYFAWKGA